MIMAGRGKRLGNLVEHGNKVGVPLVSELEERISEIDLTDVNLTLLENIKKSFIKMCTTKETLKSALSHLYSHTLHNKTFIEKFVIAITPLLNYEVEETQVRGELLTLMQDEFKLKDKMLETNRQKLHNAVEFLGYLYFITSNQGVSFWVLGKALLDYLNLLLKGTKDDLKVFTKEIALSNSYLSTSKNILKDYKDLQNNLRNMLFDSKTDILSKCWVLLAIELMAANNQPLTEVSREYYLSNLQDEFTQVESYLKQTPLFVQNHSSTPDSGSFSKNVPPASDITSKLTDMTLSPLQSSDDGCTEKRGMDYNWNWKKNNQNWQSGSKWSFGKKEKSSWWSEHDDRCDRDENYYCAQPQRPYRSDNHKKNFQFDKDMKKKSHLKSGFAMTKERTSHNAEKGEEKDENWD